MSDAVEDKRVAIRYWERRRVIYNLALVLPSLFAYLLTAGVVYGGDSHGLHPGYVAIWFAIYVVAANFCYSLVYVLEFLFRRGAPDGAWRYGGRPLIFTVGLILSLCLSFIGGRDIALLEFSREMQTNRAQDLNTER